MSKQSGHQMNPPEGSQAELQVINPNAWHADVLATLQRDICDRLLRGLEHDDPMLPPSLIYVNDDPHYEALNLIGDDEPDVCDFELTRLALRLRHEEPRGVSLGTLHPDPEDEREALVCIYAADERGKLEGWTTEYARRKDELIQSDWQRVPDEELGGHAVWAVVYSVNNNALARDFLKRHGPSIGVTVQ
jgi:hypothetical protein